MRIFLPSTFLLVVLFHLTSTHAEPTKILCLDEEKEALLDFKLSFVTDPSGLLSSWSIDNDDDCCNWDGVTCDDDSPHVVGLNLGWGFLKSNQLRPSLLALQHLTYLDLSRNQFAMRIPNFLGCLSKLTDLDLSKSSFHGEIPPYLGNLSNLENLILGPSNHLRANSLQWLSSLSSIQKLDLSGINLSNAIDWVSTLKVLPNLYEFACKSCSLPSLPLSSISFVNSTSLESLDLSNTSVSLSTFSSLINGSNNLRTAYLNHMQLETYTLHGFLEALNSMNGYSLEDLSLVDNNLNKLPFEGVMFPSLKKLDVSSNILNEVALRDLVALTSLTSVDVSSNSIRSSFHRILHYLSPNLTHLDLSSNFIYSVITDTQLSKFTQLKSLILSNNSLLTFNISQNWIAPFQLDTLHLESCVIGPTFLNWILTQKKLKFLDISNSTISGAIPDVFWNFSTRLSELNVSHNQISCKIPDLTLWYDGDTPSIDLSNNAFYGPIPLFLFTSYTLDLSHNMFSKLPPSHRSLLNNTPTEIDLSNNRLSGSLPKWLFQFDNPIVLSLANNMLSGTLPVEMGSLWQLYVLHLSNNNFSGELPSSMKNCIYLNTLELASNKFSGSVPIWIGESMPNLLVLTLRSNNFFGDLPSRLCYLQSLQILDLSENQISGPIPGCIHNFTAMAENKGLRSMAMTAEKLTYSYENGYFVPLDYASITWKGAITDIYRRGLDQRNIINLSGNMLSGEIPIGVTTLKDLRSLDLSRNGLSGSIPDNIGQIKSLELLNLSSNRLSGEIPQSLAGLTYLSILNLSNNNLSGRIPSSTQLQSFDASFYAGNPELCGEPLPIKCERQPLHKLKKGDHGEPFDIQAFLAASGMGFAFGLLGVIGMVHYNRRFRVAFFDSVHKNAEMIIFTTSLYHSRIKRRLSFKKENGAAI